MGGGGRNLPRPRIVHVGDQLPDDPRQRCVVAAAVFAKRLVDAVEDAA